MNLPVRRSKYSMVIDWKVKFDTDVSPTQLFMYGY